MKHFTLSFLFISLLFCSCGDGKQQKNPDSTDTLAMLSALLKKDPQNADLYYQQADYYFRSDRLKDALESCNKAISLDNQKAKYYVLLADINLKSGQSEATRSALEKALLLEPENVPAIVKQAELSLLLRDYDRAIEEANKAITLDKLNANAFFIKGYTLKEKGDTNSAVAFYKEAIKIDPDYEMAYEELGILYALRKDKVAEDYLTSAINLNPKNIQAMYALAIYYQDINKPEEAHAIYENILSISPQNANALHNIGYIELVYNNNLNEAVEYFTRAIDAAPDFTEAFFNRAFTYEKLNKKTEAVKDYKMVLELNPNHQKAKDALKRLGAK